MIITVASAKGGVGKTTTAIAISTILAEDPRFERTVLMDLDARADATRGLGFEPGGSRLETSFRSTERDPIGANAIETAEGFRLVPGSGETAHLETRRFAGVGADKAVARMLRALCATRTVVIDTAPGFDRALTRGAIAAADILVIPVVPEPYCAMGALDAIEVARLVTGVKPQLLLVATMVETRRTLTTAVFDDLAEHGCVPIGNTPRAVAAAEAPWKGRSVVQYAPRSSVTRAYREIVSRIIDVIPSIGERAS